MQTKAKLHHLTRLQNKAVHPRSQTLLHHPKAATAAETEKTGARPKVPKDNPERRHLPFRRLGTEEYENGFPNAQQKIINDMHYKAYWEQEQEKKDRKANEEQRLSLERTLRQNNEHVKATKAVEELAQAAAQKGQKKRKPKLADPSTYETALRIDAAFIDTMRNLNMDKQPTGTTRHSIKSPHVKSEPSFLAELKNELEEILARPLEPYEDVLAIASTVLRQCMGNMYNTANNLTAAIEAAEVQRNTRRSGAVKDTDRDVMANQLATNFQNLLTMEQLLVQVQRHMTADSKAKVSPRLYLDEESKVSTRSHSPTSTQSHTSKSTRMHSRQPSRHVTPGRKTTHTTPGHDSDGQLDATQIAYAINKLTEKLKITDPSRVAATSAPLLKLATMDSGGTTHPVHQSSKASNATHNHGTGATNNNQGTSVPQNQSVPQTSGTKTKTQVAPTATSTGQVAAINMTAAPNDNSGSHASSYNSDSNKYYRNVEPRQFTGKQYDDVEMFLRNINRFMQRARITNNDEKVDYLHKHLTTEVRITLNKTLTWEETCDYDTQVDFLRKWWPRPNDIEPLRDEFNRMKLGQSETVEEYARRIQMQRSAGWPDESKDIEMRNALRLREGSYGRTHQRTAKRTPDNSWKQVPFLETFEIGKHTIDDLLKYIKLQMRNMERRARAFCKHCGKNSNHSTEECTRNKKVSAVKLQAEDDTVSTYSTISEDVEPKPYDIYCNEEYGVNAVQTQDPKPRAPAPVQQQQQQQPFRQPFKKPFPGQQGNFRNAAPQNNFRPRFQGAPQRKPLTPEMKKFVVCYNCGEEGHYSKECTSEKVKQPEGPVTVEEMREMLKHFDNIKRILWRGVRFSTTDQMAAITQDSISIDEKILALEVQIEDALNISAEPENLNP